MIEIFSSDEILGVVGEHFSISTNSVTIRLPAYIGKGELFLTANQNSIVTLKFTEVGTKIYGLVNGQVNKKECVFNLNPSETLSLKSYNVGAITYWQFTVSVLNNQAIQQPLIANDIQLMAIDPANLNTTDDLPEGELNLYFTEVRVKDTLSATAPIVFNDGVISTTLTQYTNEDARDAVGTALQNGTHIGISFINVDAQDKINATVNLGNFSVGDLNDVVLGGLALGNNQVLKWDGVSFVNARISLSELVDADTLLTKSGNLSGLTNKTLARTNLGLGSIATHNINEFLSANATLNQLSNVSLVNLLNKQYLKYELATNTWKNATIDSSDISNLSNVYAPINSPTFTGIPNAPTPANNSNSTQIPTTAWVKARIAEGGGGGGGATSLDQLTDVAIDDVNQEIGQTLRFSGVQYVNTKLASTDLSDTASILLKSGNLAGLTDRAIARTNLELGNVATLGTGTGINQVLKFDVANVLPAVSGVNLTALPSIDKLSDVDISGGVNNGQTLVWDGLKFIPSNPASTYTDEDARNAVGTALTNGVHSGISFTNDNLNNVINAIVSITSANIDLNELILALGLGTSAFANTGTGEGDVAVFGADGLIVGVSAFDNGFIADDPVEASLDNGFIV